jgi:hypothetical protein
VTRVTGAVGRTVSGTGSAVGGTVKQVTGAAGSAVAGGTVSKLGALLGG